MNFIKRWIAGKVVKEMGGWIKAKLGKNRTTNLLGILAVVYALSGGAIAVLDDDPNTNPDIQKIVLLLGGGTVALKARQQDQHELDEQEKRRLLQ